MGILDLFKKKGDTMSEKYEKSEHDEKQLKVIKTEETVSEFSLDHIEKNIAVHQEQLTYWEKLKSEAEKLEIQK